MAAYLNFEEIRIAIFRYFQIEKINKLLVNSNKEKNNFVGLITNGLGLNVDHRPPVGPCYVMMLY
jgi:hypothetical protein